MRKLTRRDFLKRVAGAAALLAVPRWPWQHEAPPLVVDAHEDIAWNMLNFGRDYTRSAHETRAHETGTGIPWRAGNCTLGLPDWLRGRVGVIFATVFAMPARHAHDWDVVVYADAGQAHEWGVRQMEAYEEMGEPFRLINTARDLEEVVSTWAPSADPEKRRVGLVRSMEGADPIRAPAECGDWFERGLRIVGPAWKRTRYAGGTGEPGPLTELGGALLDEMASVGMMLDLSHAAEETFYQALERFDGVVLASHSNPRAFCPWDRCLSDDMIALLAAREGVVGTALYNGFLKPGWKPNEDSRTDVSVQDAADVIDYVCQLLGDCQHVGIGSDFDGGLGWEHIPHEMDTVADLLLIADVLRARGYAEADIEAIMGGNWLRLLREGLPA